MAEERDTLISRLLRRLIGASHRRAAARDEPESRGARAATPVIVYSGTQPAHGVSISNSLEFSWRHPYLYACCNHIATAGVAPPLRVLRLVPSAQSKRQGRYITRATTRHVQRHFAAHEHHTSLAREKRTEWLLSKGVETVEVPDDHELRMLLDRVNPLQAWESLIYQTLFDWVAAGNAYWELVGGTDFGKPHEIWRLRPDRMTVRPDPQRVIAGYTLTVNNRRVEFDRDEVLHFRAPHPLDDYYGLGAAATLDLILQTDWNRLKYAHNFFARGAQLSGLLVPAEGTMVDEELWEREIERFEAKYAGPDNVGRIGAMLHATWQPISTPPRDADYLGMAQRHDQDISAVTGVPTPLFRARDVNRSNYEGALLQFWSDTMAPILRFIAGHLNEFLCPRFGDDIVVEFDLSQIAVLHETRDAIVERESRRFNDGILTINEYRQLTGQDPWPAGGDVVKRAATDVYVPAGKEEEASGGESAPGAAEAAPEQPEEDEAHQETAGKPGRLKAGSNADDDDGLMTFGSPAHRKAVAGWERRLRPFESRMVKAIQRWGEELRQTVLSRLGTGKGLTVPDPDYLFVVEHEGSVLWRQVFGISDEAMRAAGQTLLTQVGLEGLTFDTESPRVLAYYAQKELLVKTVASDLHEELRGIVSTGLREGRPIVEIAEDVNARFDHLRDWQARRIAQTETVGAMNCGNFGAMEQAQIGTKEWIATLDDRVRDSHAAAMDEGPIPLDEHFVSNGLLYPGEAGAPPEEVINCRCTLATSEQGVTPEEAEGEVAGEAEEGEEPILPSDFKIAMFDEPPRFRDYDTLEEQLSDWRKILARDIPDRRAFVNRIGAEWRIIDDDELAELFEPRGIAMTGGPDFSHWFGMTPEGRATYWIGDLATVEQELWLERWRKFQTAVTEGKRHFTGKTVSKLYQAIYDLDEAAAASRLRAHMIERFNKAMRRMAEPYGGFSGWLREAPAMQRMFAEWRRETLAEIARVQELARGQAQRLDELLASKPDATLTEIIDAIAINSEEEATALAQEWMDLIRWLPPGEGVTWESQEIIRGRCMSALIDLARITNPRLLRRVMDEQEIMISVKRGVRAHSGTNFIPMQINHLDNPEMIMHEFLHRIEMTITDDVGAPVGAAWRDARASSLQTSSLRKLLGAGYDVSEVAVVDDWHHPYVGKVYPGFESEVVSMMAQLLGECRRRGKIPDRAHLEFVLGVLRGATGGG